ncbi:MAG: metallophosphoesterase, partial [Eubacteriales bacterium]
MKIFQISDLHIIPTSDVFELKSKADKMCAYIRGIIPQMEQVIFFVLGDIGDGGNISSYRTASKLFDCLLEQLSGWDVLFEFIPGNHDLCNGNIDEFDCFISKYQHTKHKYSDSSTFSIDYGGVNFIFASSVVHNDHKNGQVNIESVKSNIKPRTENVLLLHHSLINEDIDDHSSIGNSAAVLEALSTAGVRFVLHGHTHKNGTIQLGDVFLVGSGSPFKDMSNSPNINNQFNTVQIEKGRITGIANCRYIADWNKYIGYTIFPIPQDEYSDPLAIEKDKFNAVEGYIERKILPYSIIASDNLAQYFNGEKRVSLFEACKEHRLLLLLSDAGTGKSMELNQLAYLLSDSASPYYPVHICLNIYSGKEFIDLLPSKYRRLDPCQLFWIIDGFDELEVKYIKDFKRQLAEYTSANQQTHIVLSTRSNFCKTTTADKGFETFPGFREYGICSLEREAVIEYVVANNLNGEDFLKEIHERGLTGLESVPFYLIKMTIIYKVDNRLPNKSELMDQLITLRFKWDSSKYDYTIDNSLDEQRVEIF